MLLQRLCTLLVAAASTAHGFKNTSPFLMLSTEELRPNVLQSSQISTASSLEDRIIDSLDRCDAKAFIFISSTGLTATDLRHMERLKRWSTRKEYRSVIEIPEVVGQYNTWATVSKLAVKCDAKKQKFELSYPPPSEQQTPRISSEPTILTWNFPSALSHAIDGNARAQELEKADKLLDHHLSTLTNHSVPHVLIWTSTPPASRAEEQEEEHTYDMDSAEPPFQSIMHTDLKRALDLESRARNSSSDPQAGLPLFEKYQFLSPGIFMGLSVSLLLFLILYVGVSAIAGLEVSYMAFSKEMGPAAQNKGKQQ